MPTCADHACGRWRPERLTPSWLQGFRLNGRWYCSQSCLEGAVRVELHAPRTSGPAIPALPPLRVGVLLQHLGALTRPQLELALSEQRRTGLRLGAQARALGLVDADAVLRCLAAQAGVNYLSSFDLGRVHGCSPLPQPTVRALGLVPFDWRPADRAISVACMAPLPRTALRTLTRLTGWQAEAFLVDDQTWDAALSAYRPAAAEQPFSIGAAVAGADAVVARIMETALRDRAVTMRHAECNAYTWVRVEGEHQTSDLLMAGRTEEGLCQAAVTAH